MRTGAFSLIEVLTAVVIMGLLVATIVPLQRRLLVRQVAIEDAIIAQGILDSWIRTQALLPPSEHQLVERTDWYLRVDELQSDQSLLLKPARRWFRIVIHRRSDQATLAETWVAMASPGNGTP